MNHVNSLLFNFVLIVSCSMPQSFSLDQSLALRDASFTEIKQYLSLYAEQTDVNASYMNLTNLTELHNPEVHPGYFYFRDNKFVLLYIGDRETLNQLNPTKLQERFGKEEAELRSRVGKRFVHLVYPNAGVAFSTDDRTVRILEIFSPMSLEDYKSTIYKEPPPFRK